VRKKPEGEDHQIGASRTKHGPKTKNTPRRGSNNQGQTKGSNNGFSNGHYPAEGQTHQQEKRKNEIGRGEKVTGHNEEQKKKNKKTPLLQTVPVGGETVFVYKLGPPASKIWGQGLKVLGAGNPGKPGHEETLGGQRRTDKGGAQGKMDGNQRWRAVRSRTAGDPKETIKGVAGRARKAPKRSQGRKCFLGKPGKGGKKVLNPSRNKGAKRELWSE